MQYYTTESSLLERYIPLNIYSHILAIGIIFVGVFSLLLLFGYLFSEKLRKRIATLSWEEYILIIGGISTISTIAVLLYQYAYGLLVCELCWWQRICMFPIEFIAFWSIVRRIQGVEPIIMSLSAFGIFFAGYHYSLHARSWVLGQTITTPCEIGGILPSCADPEGVVIWGFLTIPFMALIAFMAIFILAWISKRIRNSV